MSDISGVVDPAMERVAMTRSGYGAWALCVVLGVVSLALLPSTLGQATNTGCPGDLTNKVTKFETQNLVCKKYSFPASNPYVIWVCSSLFGLFLDFLDGGSHTEVI